jgi:hypothetical protein
MAVWPPHLVKVRAAGKRRGSGWALGLHGVLTAWHVIKPHIDDPWEETTNPKGVRCWVEVADDVKLEASVAWFDEHLELAVLQVSERDRDRWHAWLFDEPATTLSGVGTDPITNVTATGFPDATLDDRQTNPEQVVGSLLPGSGLPGRVALDIDSSVPPDVTLWHGMSGAVVRDSNRRVLGIVTQALPDRARRRLHVAPLPELDEVQGWKLALESVAARPVVEAIDAPLARAWLQTCDPAGRPWRVRDIPDSEALGVRRPRTDIASSDDPYFPYLDRPEADDLAGALSAALAEGSNNVAPKLVVLVGESAAGKSRLARTGVLSMPELANYRLVRPRFDRAFGDMPPSLCAGRVLLWLDDLHRYSVEGISEDSLNVLLGDHGLALATIRRDRLRRMAASEFQSGLGKLIENPRRCHQIDIAESPNWRLSGAADLQIQAVRTANAAGIGLGEYLAAYKELVDRYQIADGWQKSLIDAVTDWARTGMDRLLSESEAREVWIAILPDALSVRYREALDEQQDLWYFDALAYATDQVIGSSSLLVRNRHGLRASDVPQVQRIGEPISGSVWAKAEKDSSGDPAQASSVALQAVFAHQYEIAGRIWSGLAGNDPVAAFNLGALRTRVGDAKGAADAYQLAIDSGHTDRAPMAAVNLGTLRASVGDAKGAAEAYQLAIDSGHADAAPLAAYSLGLLRASGGDAKGAADAYQLAIDSGHPDQAPMAAYNLGLLRASGGDAKGAAEAYQLAVDLIQSRTGDSERFL